MGFAFLLGACSESASPQPEFDFSHFDLAVQYFEGGSENILEEIAATDAAGHLKNHSDQTGYYPPDATALDITRDLLGTPPTDINLQQAKELASYAKENPDRQRLCLAEADKYLPPEAKVKNPLHITWGYDIGVAMDDHASVNLTHSHLLDNPEEVWFYCTHEGHHSGVMQLHPMSIISEIDTTEELYEFVRYATFLEGLAVYAAWDARRVEGALNNDRDYVNLENPEKLEHIMAAYWQTMGKLENAMEAPLNDQHWQMIEDMSSGDRLWYVTGAWMAKSIEMAFGREGLIEIIRAGPDAFFKSYDEIQS